MMARGTSSYLNTVGIACKCFATATARTFVPSAAEAQATGCYPAPKALLWTARATSLFSTVATLVCKCFD